MRARNCTNNNNKKDDDDDDDDDDDSDGSSTAAEDDDEYQRELDNDPSESDSASGSDCWSNSDDEADSNGEDSESQVAVDFSDVELDEDEIGEELVRAATSNSAEAKKQQDGSDSNDDLQQQAQYDRYQAALKKCPDYTRSYYYFGQGIGAAGK